MIHGRQPDGVRELAVSPDRQRQLLVVHVPERLLEGIPDGHVVDGRGQAGAMEEGSDLVTDVLVVAVPLVDLVSVVGFIKLVDLVSVPGFLKLFALAKLRGRVFGARGRVGAVKDGGLVVADRSVFVLILR